MPHPVWTIWSTIRHILFCGTLIAAVNTALIFSGAVSPHLDFVSFYTASREVAAGVPAAAYSAVAHHAAEIAATGCCGDGEWYAFFYPPIMLLLCWPLAALPYIPALFAWSTVQLFLFLAAVRAVVGRGKSLLPYAAFPAAAMAFTMGQNALLTAAIFAAGTAALGRGRPFLAGLLLGCLAYKPHFGLLLPIAFIAGREWRAVAGAAVSALGLVIASALAFGWETWAVYLHMFGSSAIQTFQAGGLPYAYLISPYGAARLLGASNGAAQAVQAVSTIVVAVLVGTVWRRTRETAPRAAILAAGTLLAVPVILFYDLMPAAVAMAWLAVDAGKVGWRPNEKAILALVFVIALVERKMSQVTGVPYGPVVGIIMLALAWQRAAISFPKKGEVHA